MEEKKNQKKSKKKGFGGSAGKAELSNAAKIPFPQLKKSKFGRDNQFAEYLDPGEVSRGLQEGSLIEGVLRINPKAYEDAFIPAAEVGAQDILIKGVRARCRALNGDVVVVRLDSPHTWKVNHEAVQDFMDRYASDEDRQILMESCKVNPKLEKPDAVDTLNISQLKVALDEELQARHSGEKVEKIPDISIIDISSECEESIPLSESVPVDLIKNSVDPLESVPVASCSDNESNKSEEEDLEDEHSVAAKVKLKCVNISSSTTNTTYHSDSDVVVEAVDVSADSVKTSKKARRGKRGQKKGDVSLSSSVNTSVASSSSGRQARLARQKPKPLVEYQVLSVLKHPKWQKLGLVQRTGVVVAIKEMKHSRLAAGTIRLLADNNNKFFLFSPTDSRVPRMKIPMGEAPPNLQTRNDMYAGVMYIGKLVRWDLVSSALGRLERSLGSGSDIAVRSEALLLENCIDYGEFSAEALACLPPDCDTWKVTEKEIKKRRDFRSECVFTIDPATARDLDDALSVTPVGEGKWRVAVHIADVSHFVRAASGLDRAAAARATSTYLVDRVVPMLPRPLCEKLCSLNPHEDRLTFTVEWTLGPKAEVLSEWFGRTVIRSCAKLAYEDAQCLLEGRAVPELAVAAPHTTDQVAAAVSTLNRLAVILRQRREQAGALRLDQPKLCFTLNRDTGLPDGFYVHEHRDSNKLIEEFMLLANMAVARKIFTAFPDLAVLRRHPDPKMDMLDKTVDQLGCLGVEVEGLSAAALARSITRLREAGNTVTMAAVTHLCSKPMELARYFCTGLAERHEFHHYALNVPLYTHFTSPIRRYPDILVHRLLDLAVTGGSPAWDPVQVGRVTEHCNDRRLTAKRVGEASAELFLALFIAECGPLTGQPGVVVQVMDHSLDVLIMKIGQVKRVYIDRLTVSQHRFRRVGGVSYCDLVWPAPAPVQCLTLLSPVLLTLSQGDRPFDWLATVEPPQPGQQQVVTLDTD